MPRGTSAGRGGCQGPDHPGRETSTPRSAGPTSTRLGRQKGDLQKQPPGGINVEPADHALGRYRHGLTSRIHLAVEQGQKPLSAVITAGRVGVTPQFEPALEAIWMSRPGVGRPRERPDWVPGPQGVRLPQQSRRPARTRDQGHNLGPDLPRPQRPMTSEESLRCVPGELSVRCCHGCSQGPLGSMLCPECPVRVAHPRARGPCAAARSWWRGRGRQCSTAVSYLPLGQDRLRGVGGGGRGDSRRHGHRVLRTAHGTRGNGGQSGPTSLKQAR